MALPGISENSTTNKDKADGGIIRDLIGFFISGKVAGRRVGALRIMILLDAIFTVPAKDPKVPISISPTQKLTIAFMSFTAIILAIGSFCNLFPLNKSESPHHWQEIITKSLISGIFVQPSDQKDSSLFVPQGSDFYWALGIHLLVLLFYLYRWTVSFNLLRGLSSNVPNNFRMDSCSSWMLCTIIFIVIDYFAFIVSKDIPKEDAVGIVTEIIRLSFAMFPVRDFYYFVKKTQRKEQNALKEFPVEV